MIRSDKKGTAIQLRRRGYSYSLIQRKVPVSKGTLSRWLRDVPFFPNQEVSRRISANNKRLTSYSKHQKTHSINKAKLEAKQEVGLVKNRDLFMLGLGVYIGEGSKTKDITRVVNADPNVILLCIRWLTTCLDLKRRNLSLAIHLYPDNDERECLHFWSKTTGIPLTQFGKTQVDRRAKKSVKSSKLPYGTAHLHVKSCGEERFGAYLSRKILAEIEEVYDQVNKRD